MKWACAIWVCALLAAGLYFRVAHLGTLPGINGDEAWYGAQVVAYLEGEPHTFRNPDGRLESVFHLGPLILLHRWLEPSFPLLRLPALCYGLLLLPLAWWVCSRLTDRTMAWLGLLALACLPVAIAYTRFGWPPGQVELVGLLAVYGALRGRWLLVGMTLAIGYHAYPTAVFLVPVVLGPPVARWLYDPGRAARRKWLAVLGGAALLALAAGLAMLASEELYYYLRTRGIGYRLRNPGRAVLFLQHFGRLLTGVTVYEYLVGPLSPWSARLHDLIGWGLLVPLLGVGLRRAHGARDTAVIGLAGGLLASTAALYLIGGVGSIQPHYERYSLHGVVPLVLLLVLILHRFGRRERVVVGTLLLCTALLLSFGQHYWMRLLRTGGTSSMTARAARVEPKQQAVAAIRGDLQRAGRRQALVLAGDWWSYWAIRYLFARERGITVRMLHDPLYRSPALLPPEQFLPALRDGAYVVGYAGGVAERRVRAAVAPEQTWTVTVVDHGGRPVLHVWRLR